jgi:hypothetical protein
MKLVDLLKSIAPTVATVLGGPLAGLAVKTLGDAIGVDEPTQEKIERALTGSQLTAEQILAIKNADQALIVKLKELDIRIEEVHAANTDSARKMQASTQSRVPGALAAIITIGFFGILIGIMSGKLSTADNSELLILLGALAASWGAVVNFYFGSSAGSQSKDLLLAKK